MTTHHKRLTPLVNLMAEEMLVRNFSPSTIDSYTYQVDRFQRHFAKPVGAQTLPVSFFAAAGSGRSVACSPDSHCQIEPASCLLRSWCAAPRSRTTQSLRTLAATN